MQAALAAVPPVVALGLLLARVRPLRAALAALISACVVMVGAFPTPVAVLGTAFAGVLPTCVEVALILFGGVLLNELMTAGGANGRVADWLEATCREPARAVVLILLGVTPFAESVTGFGVGVVVAVPLLHRLGLSPTRAAITGLLGLIIVPWGALGPGTLVASEFTGVDLQRLGVLSALLSLPVFLLVGVSGVVIAVGLRQARRAVVELAVGTVALGSGVWAVNAYVGVPLAGVLGGLFSIAALLVLTRLREDRESVKWAPGLVWALRPYAVLVAGLLCGRGIAAWVGAPWQELVASPALWLLLTCAVVPVLLSLSRSTTSSALKAGVDRWRPVATTTVVFLVLGALLTAAGMSAALAQGASSLGAGYLFAAPFLGGLGGFLTGSNAGANAMFAASQAAAAHTLGFSVPVLVAVQNVSASLATMTSVPRVALAIGLARESSTPLLVGSTTTATREPEVDQDRVLGVVLLVNVVVLAVLGAVTASILL